ncbi:hypothetical protein D3C85_771370 [compost metagenome]
MPRPIVKMTHTDQSRTLGKGAPVVPPQQGGVAEHIDLAALYPKTGRLPQRLASTIQSLGKQPTLGVNPLRAPKGQRLGDQPAMATLCGLSHLDMHKLPLAMAIKRESQALPLLTIWL